MTAPTFSGASGNLVPKGPEIPPQRRRRWHMVLSLVILLVLSVAGYGVYALIKWHQEQEARLCPGLTETDRPEYSLSMVNGECIGWTIEQDYGFSPAISDITSKIIKQNQQVAQRGTRYARIAVLMPMTGNDTTVMPESTIINALRGVYTAQSRANDPDNHTLGSTSLAFQVVLANGGKAADQWRPVIDQLAKLTGGDHPLVAVTGLGSSVPNTKSAADALSERGIPVIGAVLTATDMVSKTLFHVSPSNEQYMAALRAYVDKHRGDLASGFLLRDSKDDNYLNTLIRRHHERIRISVPAGEQHLAYTSSRDAGIAVPNLFKLAADKILCTEKTDILFFSGRSRDLASLINELANHTGCVRDKPIVIAVVTTGLGALDTDSQLVENMRSAKISVINASSTDYRSWAVGMTV